MINACISHVIIRLIRYFLIPKSRDLVSHNPGISGLNNGPGSRDPESRDPGIAIPTCYAFANRRGRRTSLCFMVVRPLSVLGLVSPGAATKGVTLVTFIYFTPVSPQGVTPHLFHLSESDLVCTLFFVNSPTTIFFLRVSLPWRVSPGAIRPRLLSP